MRSKKVHNLEERESVKDTGQSIIPTAKDLNTVEQCLAKNNGTSFKSLNLKDAADRGSDQIPLQQSAIDSDENDGQTLLQLDQTNVEVTGQTGEDSCGCFAFLSNIFMWR